jgi:glycosyltransferase involved in cell wall biosynthesis
MKSLLIFDAETQHYRQSIYRYFAEEFEKLGYRLTVIYDKGLNSIEGELFHGIDYTMKNFNRVIKENDSQLVILFVWLRYKFLLPFMCLNRIKGIKMITWSHGINLQHKDNLLKNQLYYMRQRLAHALIIFSENERQFIKASHNKLFVANNTLNFNDFPVIKASKQELKEACGFTGKTVVLCVGRMNTNNRKLEYLLEGFEKNAPKDSVLVLVGPGVTEEQETWINRLDNIHYYGTIYNAVRINKIYKMSDLFCMPGAIGLAVNHAFYYGLPVVVEDVEQGPEAIFIQTGKNGFFFRKSDVRDMMDKVGMLCADNRMREQFSEHAQETIRNEASIENMLGGFLEAINYVAQ